ncbi:hypothetical protein JTB14_023677 [Gonioctena quinquepunctata]|nr:hypothetical protein JTB14_023677 [Gonioctena quinquepunctata]
MNEIVPNDNHRQLIELNEKCRICLQSSSEMNSFFEIYFEDLTLANVFKTISSCVVTEDDRLPKNICESCSEVVINFNNMISIFQENEEYLINLSAMYRYYSTDTNGNVEKIEYFDETNVDKIVECVGVDVTIDNERESSASPENDRESSASPENDRESSASPENDRESSASPKNDYDEILMEKAYSEETSTKIQIDRPVPQIDKYEIIGNGDYNSVQTVKYTCDSCGDCFLYKAGFRQHMQYKHNTMVEETELDQYTTEIKLTIPTGFPNNIEYVPTRNNARKNKLQCRICTLCFTSPEQVKQHEEIHKTHICDQCGAAFLKKHYLSDHLLIHSDDRHYKCRICGKTFRHRHTLSVHKRTHDISRSFVCETCGAGFRARCTLLTHMRLKHTDERNYPCTACNLKFNLKSSLDKHFLRKHTSNREKSFVCNKCGAAYLNKTTLTRHIAEKHLGKAKTYPCNICENKVYTTKKSLSSHLQNKHHIF